MMCLAVSASVLLSPLVTLQLALPGSFALAFDTVILFFFISNATPCELPGDLAASAPPRRRGRSPTFSAVRP